MNTIRIATRKSPLAIWQAEHVRSQLLVHHPGLTVELVRMTTQGDRFLHAPLATLGGKGLFLKELEEGLLDARADIAVHSMKDVTVELPEGLHIPVICERAEPFDAFVSNHYDSLTKLPDGATVGTSSLRRRCQIMHAYPQLEIVNLRGNVNTRLRKLDDGEYDAIILAAAGLRRLGFDRRIRSLIQPQTSLPAVGQGAVGIECRRGDARVNDLLQPLDHPDTHLRVRAERALNAQLEGGCQVPIGAYAELRNGELELHGMVGDLNGRRMLRAQERGPADQPEALGVVVAQRLIAQGAREILDAIHRGA